MEHVSHMPEDKLKAIITEDTVDKELLIRERVKGVGDALRHMSLEHQEIVRIRCLQEMSYEQAAQTLRVPVGTVRSRLHRARGELKQVISKKFRHLIPDHLAVAE
jgi:RNA polymerase sigma factor (sigma-70 family)